MSILGTFLSEWGQNVPVLIQPATCTGCSFLPSPSLGSTDGPRFSSFGALLMCLPSFCLLSTCHCRLECTPATVIQLLLLDPLPSVLWWSQTLGFTASCTCFICFRPRNHSCFAAFEAWRDIHCMHLFHKFFWGLLNQCIQSVHFFLHRHRSFHTLYVSFRVCFRTKIILILV